MKHPLFPDEPAAMGIAVNAREGPAFDFPILRTPMIPRVTTKHGKARLKAEKVTFFFYSDF